MIIDDLKAGRRVTTKEYDRIIRECREDIAMQQIVEHQEKGLAFVVYGGAHDWDNNIARWNTEHPDQKFSMIRITPEHYDTPQN